MQREALLTKAVMLITQSVNECEQKTHINQISFGSSSAALVLK